MKDQSIEEIMQMVVDAPKTLRNMNEGIIKKVLEAGDEKISRHHFEVLKVLDSYGKMSISELGGRLVITNPQMTRLITELSAAGKVARKPDPIDRRKSIISLTDKGQENVTKIMDHFHQRIREILQPLSELELDELSVSLDKITQVIQKIL